VSFAKIERAGLTNVEIISGWLGKKKSKLVNGIKIGDNREKVIETFLASSPNQQATQVNVLEVESGLTGMWQYYTFSSNRLSKVEFKTDFRF
jgi:hypothetical protein